MASPTEGSKWQKEGPMGFVLRRLVLWGQVERNMLGPWTRCWDRLMLGRKITRNYILSTSELLTVWTTLQRHQQPMEVQTWAGAGGGRK